MFVAGFPAAAFGTNCYVVAPARGEECVIIDPGVGVLEPLAEMLTRHHLRPVAAMLTHGHLDHTFSVVPVCGAHGITAYIHPEDRAMLADPTLGLSSDLAAMLGQLTPGPIDTEPDDIAELADGGTVRVAGLEFLVDHAPGHTRGSVMFRLPGALDGGPAGLGDAGELCFSGDVLFRNSIGRVDLPGGDARQMADSLRRKVLPLADTTGVLPGHGPHTTIGRERLTNPFLTALAPDLAASTAAGDEHPGRDADGR